VRSFSKFEFIIAFNAYFLENIHSSIVAFQKVLVDTSALTEPGECFPEGVVNAQVAVVAWRVPSLARKI
jgi:hypothetical protein